MRIWDIPPKYLCKEHLLGEHRELHAIWNILIKEKRGYSKHPEVLRWKGKLKALYLKHEEIVKEMIRRGWQHKSPLEKRFAKGSARQNNFWQSKEKQKDILKKKNCECKIK